MRQSFLNSIKKRKKAFRNSLKEYSQSSGRKVSKHAEPRGGKLLLAEEDSIFDSLPERINPKAAASVDASKARPGRKFPQMFRLQMHDRVTELLRKKMEQNRNEKKTNKDLRRDIAERIMGKLKN